MILHQTRMLNGKLLWHGRMKVVRRSDRSKRLYETMAKMRKYN
jgi:hypothetical protein